MEKIRIDVTGRGDISDGTICQGRTETRPVTGNRKPHAQIALVLVSIVGMEPIPSNTGQSRLETGPGFTLIAAYTLTSSRGVRIDGENIIRTCFTAEQIPARKANPVFADIKQSTQKRVGQVWVNGPSPREIYMCLLAINELVSVPCIGEGVSGKNLHKPLLKNAMSVSLEEGVSGLPRSWASVPPLCVRFWYNSRRATSLETRV